MPASSTPRRRRPDPRYRVEIVDHTGVAAGTSMVRAAVETTLAAWSVLRAAISIALVDDSTIRAVNVRHLGHDWATDVITFPGDDPLQPAGAGQAAEATVSGELIISVETAAREAARRRIDRERELALYAVHGTLHLLGLDDQTPAGRAGMRRAERRIMQTLMPGRGRPAGRGGRS